MFGRPRCREWTPLTTQQLRLRSLIQIVGYNIRPPEMCNHQCSYYLTLHQTTMSAPFYTSERISSPHPKWKEIDSEITHRISSTNVVIRIWCHILSSCKDGEEANDQIQDTVIQTWGVYFSGLRYIGANLALNFNSDCFKCNTLVFQMHGGYFCSYKSLKLDIIPPENEIEQGSLSSDSSDRSKIENKLIKEIRSLSPGKLKKTDKEYSKSHSPVDRGLKQNFPTLRPSSSLNIGRKRDNSAERVQDVNQIYEHSPDLVKEFRTSDLNCDITGEDVSRVDLSETAESYDLRNEMDRVPKYRYLALNFLKSEIRPSYNATKLQNLHLLQYAIKKKQEAVQEIKESIYKKSALSDSISPEFEEKLKNRSKSQRNLFSPLEEDFNKLKSSSQSDLTKNGKIKERTPVSNGPRLTLKLNDLLSYKSKPSPFQRAEHIRLTKQLEILHFKRLILSDERDSKLANIRRLKERHAKLFEENQDVGSELMTSYHSLSRRNEALKELRESCNAMRELAARNHAALSNCRSELLLHLQKIFYIQQKDATTWTIIDVPLPICGDDTRASNPVPDSVATGFVAQATVLAAAILNQPLRYKITLLGSASKILDITPELPDPKVTVFMKAYNTSNFVLKKRNTTLNKSLPLFARGGDMTLFRYAMFLLNKCIAQLLWGRGLAVHDMRPTLANLQRLLITPCNLSDTSKLFGTYQWLADGDCPRTQSLRSLVASDRGKYSRQFNRFKECVDGHTSQKKSLQRHKHSRSDGSCYQADRNETTLNTSSTSIMGSESNLYNMKLDESSNFKTQSNPEISSMNSEDVIFTIGDDEKLLKISSNNDDVADICTAIADYCARTEAQSFGAMQTEVCPEIEDLCMGCDRNGDLCNIECSNSVSDVIVIPSAEAVIGD